MSARLIPPVSELTQPYWDAASEHQLVMQYCDSCAQHIFPPRAHCPTCGCGALLWSAVSGKGTVYSYTVAHRPPHPVFADHCPMAVAIVALEEGPSQMTRRRLCGPLTGIDC